MKNLLSRVDMENKLGEYVSRKINLKELQLWHENMLKNDFKPNDWEGDESFINEIMSIIAMSDVDGFSFDKSKEIILLLKLDESTKILTKKLYKLE